MLFANVVAYGLAGYALVQGLRVVMTDNDRVVAWGTIYGCSALVGSVVVFGQI